MRRQPARHLHDELGTAWTRAAMRRRAGARYRRHGRLIPVPRRLAVMCVVLAALFCSATVSSCAADDPPASPRATLATAKQTLDATKTVHFEVTSADLPESSTVLVSGEGVAQRPDAFDGRFRLATGGVAVTLKVVSVDGRLYAQLPFTDHFAAISARDLGIADPAELLDPHTGLSSFLEAARQPRHVGQSRVGREVLDEIRAKLPARVLDRFLLVDNPRAVVDARFFVAHDTGQLRKAIFRGPFYDKQKPTTYTIVLDRYGEPTTISKPRRLG